MAKEEKDYCECCGIRYSCGYYVSQGLQHKCEKLQIFASGMQAGIAKASLWLETEWENLGIKWLRGAQPAEIINQFEKTIEL